MAVRTLIRMFDNYVAASAAVGELEAAGFAQADVGLISSDGQVRHSAEPDPRLPEAEQDGPDPGASGAAAGASIGAVVGGSAGLLAGIGAVAIPGLGPAVAAGWLISALTGASAGAGAGAAAGGLIGVLTEIGVENAEARLFAEAIRRGATLVSVRTEEVHVGAAEAILARHAPVDLQRRADEWRAQGWTEQ